MKVTVAFDIDGTLIHQSGPKEDTPIYKNIDLFYHFQRAGCKMYIWSGGGVEYSQVVANMLGLEAEVVEKGSFKPDITIDNEVVTYGTINLQVVENA